MKMPIHLLFTLAVGLRGIGQLNPAYNHKRRAFSYCLTKIGIQVICCVVMIFLHKLVINWFHIHAVIKRDL